MPRPSDGSDLLDRPEGRPAPRRGRVGHGSKAPRRAQPRVADAPPHPDATLPPDAAPPPGAAPPQDDAPALPVMDWRRFGAGGAPD
jgi:hypothetical protein